MGWREKDHCVRIVAKAILDASELVMMMMMMMSCF